MKFLLKKKLNKINQIAHRRVIELNEDIIDNMLINNWYKVEVARTERDLWRQVINIIGGIHHVRE